MVLNCVTLERAVISIKSFANVVWLIFPQKILV